MSAARRAMSDEQGSAETIIKEAHLATYRPLVILCLGRGNPLATGGGCSNRYRIWRASSRPPTARQLSRLGFD